MKTALIPGWEGSLVPQLIPLHERRDFDADLISLIELTNERRRELRAKNYLRQADEYLMGAGDCHMFLDKSEGFPNYLTLEENHTYSHLARAYVSSLRVTLARHFTVTSLSGILRDPDVEDGLWVAGD